MDDDLFSGLITALITPFNSNRIDKKGLERLLSYQIAGGVKAVVIAGSTGEGSSLSSEEYQNILDWAVSISNRRLKIIASVSSISTDMALVQTTICAKIGVDGLMVTTPSYIRPSQEGLYQHYKTIHDSTNLPIMLYTVPVRTGVDFIDDTIIRLSQLERIVALKDAGIDTQRPLRLSAALKGQNFKILSGNDETSVSFSAVGGSGCVSVISNIFPELCVTLQDLCSTGKYQQAIILQRKILPLYKAIFSETNPVGIKYAAYCLGLTNAEVRAPLLLPTDHNQQIIKKLMDEIYDYEQNLDL